MTEPLTPKNPISVTHKSKHIKNSMMNASKRIILGNNPNNILRCVPLA